ATGLAYGAVDDPRVTLVGVLLTFAVLGQFAGVLAGVEQAHGESASHAAVRALELHWGRALEVIGDFVLFTSAFALAYVLRSRGLATANQRTFFPDALPVIIAARYAVFILFGRYTSLWRSVGMRDALRTIAAVVLSEAIAVGLLAMSDATKFATFSR